jgi:hypothetical protein
VDEAAFLAARVDEEEAWIRDFARLLDEIQMDNADTLRHQQANTAYVFGQEHMHPDRLLRQVEAGRKLLAAYRKATGTGPEDWPGDPAYCAGLLDAIKISAAVYSGHPEYEPC